MYYLDFQLSWGAHILSRLFILVGEEVNQVKFVSRMMQEPGILFTAHDGPTNDGLVELKITGNHYEGVAKFDSVTDALREVSINVSASAYNEMLAFGKKMSTRGYYWDKGFFSSSAKLWSSGFYNKVWVLTGILNKPNVRVLKLHKDTGMQQGA